MIPLFHAPDCNAYRVIGRFGSRSGLEWAAGDAATCSCQAGRFLREVNATVSEAEWAAKREWGPGWEEELPDFTRRLRAQLTTCGLEPVEMDV